MHDLPPEESHPGRAPEKRPYAPPRLVLYGTVVELTRSQFMVFGMPDGQPGPFMMGFFMKSF